MFTLDLTLVECGHEVNVRGRVYLPEWRFLMGKSMSVKCELENTGWCRAI